MVNCRGCQSRPYVISKRVVIKSIGAAIWPRAEIVNTPDACVTVTTSDPMRTPRSVTKNRDVALGSGAWARSPDPAHVVKARRPTLRWRTSPFVIDIATQYRIIAAGAGWLDKTARGRLRFDGADRARFLQALLTNEVATVHPGSGTYALYLTPQGRMIADLHVFVRPDCLIADVPAALAPALAEIFDRLIFAEEVRVTDQSRALHQISVQGGGSPAVLARALHVAEDAVERLSLWSQIDIEAGFLARTDDVGEGSWDVVTESGDAGRVVLALEAAGAIPVSAELADAMRIDAGRPAFGVDMTDETIPLEAGLLDRAISQTKGCYVGQEVIIRVLHRGGGRVAKRLVRIECEDADLFAVPVPGAAVSIDEREVGRVTSSAWSPRAGRGVALAYVHRDAAEPTRSVTVTWTTQSDRADPVQRRAVITALAG